MRLKFIAITILFFLVSVQTLTQQTNNVTLYLGDQNIGYADTLLFDDSIQYNQFNYSGTAPVFVQVWFPTKDNSKDSRLTIGDLKPNHLPDNLKEVYNELQTRNKQITIESSLTYDLVNDEEINYQGQTLDAIFQMVMEIETKAVRKKLPKKFKNPVIVYHHGSQGWSIENFMMAEYFASHGYIFIAANFHLPYPNKTYGLLPYDLEMKNKHDQSTAKRVIRFAESITKNENIFYVGHSWGAQEGWCFLHEDTPVSGFVSLETTIEYKSDSLIIKDFWPYVYKTLKEKQDKLNLPVLACASADVGLNFDFFKNASLNITYFASYKLPFAHNSYTSIYLLRYLLKGKIPVPDEIVLKEQWEGYAEHLYLMHDFFESVIGSYEIQKSFYEGDFKFY